MKNKIKNRICGSRGFTLAEVLIAVLILVMATGVMAAGMPAAVNAYHKVTEASNAQVLLSTTVTSLRDELGTASEVEVPAGSTTAVTYLSAGSRSRLSLDADGIFLEPYIDYYPDKADNAYARLLVSKAAANGNLVTVYDSVSYDDGVVTFTNLAVKRDSTTLSSVPELKIRVLGAA